MRLPLVHVDASLLEDKVGVPPANTGNGSKRIHNALATIDVSPHNTENVLEILCDNDRHVYLQATTLGICIPGGEFTRNYFYFKIAQKRIFVSLLTAMCMLQVHVAMSIFR